MSVEHDKKNRLFVPLSSEPFEWFSSGQKKWELRKLGRQYTSRHIKVGREVELRRGYSDQMALWGKIIRVVEADNILNMFNAVPYSQVIPTATSLEDAVEITRKILKVDNETRLIAFSVGQIMKKIPLSAELIPLVASGKKTSTVRLGKRHFETGEALLVSGAVEIPIQITDVSHTKVGSLNEATARRDGYETISDLLRDLAKYYPGISNDNDVTIIGFRRHELDQGQD